MSDTERIVAEVSKNWREEVEPDANDTISRRFEHVISVNNGRGYGLESWKYQQTAYQHEGSGRILETIIAVFVKRQ